MRKRSLKAGDGGEDACSEMVHQTYNADADLLPGITMIHQKLDNEELLRLALDAMNTGRDAESLELLRSLLERDPGNVHARYLLAAQHAQLGMMDRAEEGFRAVVASAPELEVARFQLGQLLLVKGQLDDARAAFAPLATASNGQALGSYARALTAASFEDIGTAISELEQGLSCVQDIPALAGDMRRLLEQLGGQPPREPPAGSPAPLFLSGYGRQG